MSKEDEIYEAAVQQRAGVDAALALLRSEDIPGLDKSLLDDLESAFDDDIRVKAEVRDCIKEFKRTKYPSDDWKIRWASKRERLELERTQVYERGAGILTDLTAQIIGSGWLDENPDGIEQILDGMMLVNTQRWNGGPRV